MYPFGLQGGKGTRQQKHFARMDFAPWRQGQLRVKTLTRAREGVQQSDPGQQPNRREKSALLEPMYDVSVLRKRPFLQQVQSRRMYILIVEDDPFLSYDLREALLILHPDIREARSVRAAMLILATGLPYLAILDYNLKAETTAAVAIRLARENVPFCYVTADGDGVRDDPTIPDCPIVAKPYRLDDVTGLVARLLKS